MNVPGSKRQDLDLAVDDFDEDEIYPELRYSFQRNSKVYAPLRSSQLQSLPPSGLSILLVGIYLTAGRCVPRIRHRLHCRTPASPMSMEREGEEANKLLLVFGNHGTSSNSVVVASTTIAIAGSFVFGISAITISDVFCILGYLCMIFSKSFLWLDLGRLSIGCGIGLLSYVVPVYIPEITPKNLRGRFAAVNQLMICCGAPLAYALGTFITWRTLAIVSTLVCLDVLFYHSYNNEHRFWIRSVV